MAFGRKKNDLVHGAHLKSPSAGTNEVSFNVLEGMHRRAQGGDEGSSDSAFGRLKIFTLPGKQKGMSTPEKEKGVLLPSGEFVTQSSSTQSLGAIEGISSSDNVLGGKSRGSRSSGSSSGSSSSGAHRSGGGVSRGFGKVAVVVLAVALGLGGAYAGVNIAKNAEEQKTYVNTLQGALNRVSDVDKVIVDMDEILSNPIDSSSFDAMVSVQSRIGAARNKLTEAQQIADIVLSDDTQAQDKDAASNAKIAIEARFNMLTTGENLMDQARGAVQAVDLAAKAWDLVASGDAEAREAATLVSQATNEGITMSLQKTNSALEKFREALTDLEKAKDSYSDADLSAVIEYVERRISALEHAAASNEAMLAFDSATAIAENDAYTTLDAEAAELAQDLPERITDLIYFPYQNNTKEEADAYQEARDQAASVDSYLRSYLGKTAE